MSARGPKPIIEKILLADITIDSDVQLRAGMDEDAIRDYREAYENGTALPLPVVFKGDDGIVLADGFHRTQAMKIIDFLDLEVEVRQGTKRDAILYAAGCNSTHGVRRTNADKRRAVTALLSDPEWEKWSDNEIAKRCVVDAHTVKSIRESLTSEFPSEESGQRSYKTKHGTTAVMNTKKIGKKQPAPEPDITVAIPAPEIQAEFVPLPANGFIVSDRFSSRDQIAMCGGRVPKPGEVDAKIALFNETMDREEANPQFSVKRGFWMEVYEAYRRRDGEMLGAIFDRLKEKDNIDFRDLTPPTEVDPLDLLQTAVTDDDIERGWERIIAIAMDRNYLNLCVAVNQLTALTGQFFSLNMKFIKKFGRQQSKLEGMACEDSAQEGDAK